jgi:crossover junction endodeoxyribonuclease RusA
MSLWPAEVTGEADSDFEEELSAFVARKLEVPEAPPIRELADQYPVIRLKVPGIAKPQGSKRAFVNKRTQKVIMVEQVAKVADFRSDVKNAASAVMEGHVPLAGVIHLDVTFVFTRPKSHFRARGGLSTAGERSQAPTGHNLGDLSKLVRAIEDAMTGTVYGDDAQITTTVSRKRWGLAPATYITVQPDPVEG